jgi:hypothetical protein
MLRAKGLLEKHVVAHKSTKKPLWETTTGGHMENTLSRVRHQIVTIAKDQENRVAAATDLEENIVSRAVGSSVQIMRQDKGKLEVHLRDKLDRIVTINIEEGGWATISSTTAREPETVIGLQPTLDTIAWHLLGR